MTAPITSPIGPIGAMDVGGSHVTAALLDPSGRGGVLVERTAEIDAHSGPGELLEQIMGPALSIAGSASPVGWAIAMPGPFDYASGTGTFAGVDKFQALAGVDLRGPVAQRLRVDPDAVRFVNDAVAFGIGEWAAGAGGGVARMICVTLGTGVGSAFLDDGHEVHSGDTVPDQGEVHRLTIGGRPLEETISSPALRRRFRDRTGRERSVADICASARAGDPDAIDVMETAMRALGTALAPWCTRFGASRLVVGGSIARSWDVIGPPLGAGVLAASPDPADGPAPTIVPAVLGAHAPLIGAAEWWGRTGVSR